MPTHGPLGAHAGQRFEPGTFWNYQKCYVEMLVEKIDLKSLFTEVCAEYFVPVTNGVGWTDINSRVQMLRRFREHRRGGRRCVLLYCGDFDPAGC